LRQAGELELDISINKASSSFSAMAFWRDAERCWLGFFDALPWRETDGDCFSAGSINKRDHLHASILYALLTLLAGRGGEGEGKESVLAVGVGRWWVDVAAISGSFLAGDMLWRTPPCPCLFWLKGGPPKSCCSTVVLCRPPIFGAKGKHHMTPWKRLINLQLWRPYFDGAVTALVTFFIPSGSVPGDELGGRRWIPSLQIGGEADGLDCVPKKHSEVLCVIFQFVEVPYVFCTTAWN
jgi:hypothetical protein